MNLFTSSEETLLREEYLGRGYVIQPAEDLSALVELMRVIRLSTIEKMRAPIPNLDGVRCEPEALNDLKLHVMHDLERPEIRPAYYALAKKLLHTLVGNELAMQRRLNLSVQLPGDDKSLLPLHADTWTGDSPFEVVLWVPFTDCAGTQSMYFRDHFIEIKYGEVLIFDPAIPHGNVVNDTERTRWSINCRFKSIFTPYAEKRLGEFFEPITLKAASIAGLR